MQKIIVHTLCDHPVCQEKFTFEDTPEGQQTRPLMFWAYTPGRGRKSQVIRVEVCEQHERELKDLYQAMAKFDQSASTSAGE